MIGWLKEKKGHWSLPIGWRGPAVLKQSQRCASVCKWIVSRPHFILPTCGSLCQDRIHSAYVTKPLLCFTAVWLCRWWLNDPLGLMEFYMQSMWLVKSHAASLLALPYVLSQTATNVWPPKAKSCDRKQTQITHALCSVTSSPPTICFIPANPHTLLKKQEELMGVCVCVEGVCGGWGGSHRSRDLVCMLMWTVLQGEQDKDCVRPLTAWASLLDCLPPLASGFLG